MTIATVTIIGEDTAHPVLAGFLLGRVVSVGHWTHLGAQDLGALVDGLRYDRPRDVDTSRVKTRGHIAGRPLRPGAAFVRKLIANALASQPSLLIFVKDSDGDEENQAAIQQVREAFAQHPTPLILAMPHRDAEAWFVAGFAPRNEAERQRLASLRRELGFDPTTEPERLSARPNDAPQDAKRVLRRLLDLDARSHPLSIEELDRERFHERLLGDLARLRAVGVRCGLVAFLDALQGLAAHMLAEK